MDTRDKLYSFIKRIEDLILSVLAMLILWPVFIIISCKIKLESEGPVLFKQKRIGKNKKPFNIYKFRTMRADAPNNVPTHLLEKPDAYITKMGSWLRRTSIDEMPQLLNIIKGNMSIVGPRPALWNQFDLIEERDKYGANGVLPGLTGLAQIKGRDELSIQEKAKYDGQYVRNYGFLIDAKIFILTFKAVFNKDGIREGEGPKK